MFLIWNLFYNFITLFLYSTKVQVKCWKRCWFRCLSPDRRIWNYPDCVRTCYDTTASNSGAKDWAHFRIEIERRVGHGILELECRKHVGELHVTHANKAIFGATKGPQKIHYKRLKKDWLSMELNTTSMQLFDWQKYAKYWQCKAVFGLVVVAPRAGNISLWWL